jgi:hypothetical protein
MWSQMMLKIIHLIRVVCVLPFLITACGKQSETASTNPTPIQKPEPGKAVVTGKVISITLKHPLNTSVWLAEVHRQGDQAVYVLDAVNSPGIYADKNGIFVLSNITPQEYVIVVGDPEGQNEVISDGTGKPKVWNIPANQIFDTGELKVKLTK